MWWITVCRRTLNPELTCFFADKVPELCRIPCAALGLNTGELACSCLGNLSLFSPQCHTENVKRSCSRLAIAANLVVEQA